ncbi:protein MON2 homolog isoform X1 [Amphibalanus amphitrite]|uniref:protein MON2 homolog isoform X1 n=1 Tax=Amphibalanus amphitrite TaxID=1232801 RepID=UPI001C90324C|nr:protein MON2 homolog isoform X1 [Amphibalanus amphitrite]
MAARSESQKKFLENVQIDLRNLSQEAKKKYPQLKDACEEAIVKVRGGLANPDVTLPHISAHILYPLVQGCETKEPKIAKQCLGTIQRLILQQAVDTKGAGYITETVWGLMRSNIEEVKLLQTVALLLTTNAVAQGDTLAKSLALCFRLCFCKDSTVMNTAGATVRQLVSLVFERVLTEDSRDPPKTSGEASDMEHLKTASGSPPNTLKPAAADAYLLFQDLVQLVNGEQPFWLAGLTEMTRTFGLELIESILSSFPGIFYKHPEFTFLLKERVCAMVIRLFSPNLKHRGAAPPHGTPPSPQDKPYFPISMRLLRVVAVLIMKFYPLLVTECEIFLSLVVRLLEPDKPVWQRAVALEVIHKLSVREDILTSFCTSYDMKPHSTKIVQDIVNSLGAYVQSLFVRDSAGAFSSSVAGSAVTQGHPPSLLAGMPVGPGVTPQPAFYYRGVWIPLAVSFPPGATKATYLEMLDKVEPPSVVEGYGASVAYTCLIEIVRSLTLITDRALPPEPTVEPAAAADGANGAAQKTDSKSAAEPEPASSSPDASPAAADSSPTPAAAPTAEGSPTTEGQEAVAPQDKEQEAADSGRQLSCQLVNSSWCGLLAALSVLLEASTDESATEAILKAMQSLAQLSGRLELTTPRDAFITAACKASLPPHYTLTVLNPQRSPTHGPSAPAPAAAAAAAAPDGLSRQQVVAVGTALPTASLPAAAHQGPVMLTAKNLQCMRAILALAHCHGAVLGTAWHLVLTTLQHLVWILGLKPATGGSLKAAARPVGSGGGGGAAGGGSGADAAVLTTAVLADLPVLSAMLSRLFESSRYLDEVALHHLIDALNQLNHESMELAFSNREPSLFAVAKLLETGLVNLDRVEVFWRPLTSHLLDACQHPHLRMREWGAEAVTTLTRAALQHTYPTPLKDNQRLQTLLLTPLQELSVVPQADIRQRQLECTLQVLQSCGERLSHGWPLVLTIIGAVNERHTEQLVRLAFQCLQLVVTDFLPVMPWSCLPPCVDTVAKFGSQTQELNISLTAIGLMWNISDYFFQSQDKLRSCLTAEAGVFPEFPGVQNMPPFDRLWMCLFARLGDLCVDSRPAVRKSSGQTLFSTIAAHGSLLQHSTWQAVLWQVLFPLLDKVRTLSGSASTEKDDTGGNILIHHSRNTAHKQWAETQVLTLSGVARVFHSKRSILCSLADYQRAWALLLEFIQNAALNENNEVSLAALKSFQEIMSSSKGGSTEGTGSPSSAQDDAQVNWSAAWRVWHSIGSGVTEPPPPGGPTADVFVPSQPFLTALVQIFPGMFQHIKYRFRAEDFSTLCSILERAVAVPVHGEVSPFILPSLTEVVLTKLQEAVLACLDTVEKGALSDTEPVNQLIPALFDQLLTFSRYGCQAPSYGDVPTRPQGNSSNKTTDWVAMNYVPFAETTLRRATALYKTTARRSDVIETRVLEKIIQMLELPLSLKYACPAPTTWRLAVSCLLDVLKEGLVTARQHRQHSSNVWPRLAACLEAFLFSQSEPPASLSAEEQQADEALDCAVVRMLRDDVLPFAAVVPNQFLVSVMALLNRGSLHSAQHESLENGTSRLREEFANACFETLLQFSLQAGPAAARASADGGITAQLAVTALVHRFREVLVGFVEDGKLAGKCPLPSDHFSRHRMAEISFVLRAITSLLSSLKKADPEKVDHLTWQQLVELYPPLVSCTLLASEQVGRPLHDALLQYADLLRPPPDRLGSAAGHNGTS